MESIYSSTEFLDTKGNVISEDEFDIAAQSYVSSSLYIEDFSTFQTFLSDEWFSITNSSIDAKAACCTTSSSSTTVDSPSMERNIDTSSQPTVDETVDCLIHGRTKPTPRNEVLPTFTELLSKYVDLLIQFKTQDITKLSARTLSKNTSAIIENIKLWNTKMVSQYGISKSSADSWENMYTGDTLSLLSMVEGYNGREDKRQYGRLKDLESKLNESCSVGVPMFWEAYIQSVEAIRTNWKTLFDNFIEMAKLSNNDGGGVHSAFITGIHKKGIRSASILGSIFDSEIQSVASIYPNVNEMAELSITSAPPSIAVTTTATSNEKGSHKSWLSTLREEVGSDDDEFFSSACHDDGGTSSCDEDNATIVAAVVPTTINTLANGTTATTTDSKTRIPSNNSTINKYTKTSAYALISIGEFSKDRKTYRRSLTSSSGAEKAYRQIISLQSQMEKNTLATTNPTKIQLEKDSIFDQHKIDTMGPKERNSLFTSLSVISMLRELHYARLRNEDSNNNNNNNKNEISSNGSTAPPSIVQTSLDKNTFIESLADAAVMKEIQKLATSILTRLKGGDIPSLLNDFSIQLESDDDRDFVSAGYSITSDILKSLPKKDNRSDGSRVQVLVILCAMIIRTIGKQSNMKAVTLQYVTDYLQKSISSPMISSMVIPDNHPDKLPIALIEGLFSPKKKTTATTTKPSKSSKEEVTGGALSSKTAKNIASRMSDFIMDAEKAEFRLDSVNLKSRELALATVKKIGVSQKNLGKVVILCIGIIVQCSKQAGSIPIYETGLPPKWVHDYINAAVEQLLNDINLSI